LSSSALQWAQAEVGHQLGAELQLAAGVVYELEADELREPPAVILGVGVPPAVLTWAAEDPVQHACGGDVESA
jgi:hypothetical protein